jgi:UDP-MurNAc hydroxylase
MARALRYVESVGASVVIPSAGPPCFLDDGLFEFNDFDGDSANVFPDQTEFIEYMRKNGHDNARLMIPGSIAEIESNTCRIEHPIAEDAVQAIFSGKRGYLEAYKARKQPLIDSVKATWPVGRWTLSRHSRSGSSR